MSRSATAIPAPLSSTVRLTVAWPMAWLAMQTWLSGFDQRIALSPLYFLAATVLTLLIAIVTVAGQAFAVARAEPAKALRHE